MLTIQITDGAYQAHMRRLLGRLSDFTPVMEEIGGTLENLVLGRFQTRTDPSGAAWSPWKGTTLESYPFPGTSAASTDPEGAGNGRLLDRHGAMIESLSYQAGSDSVTVGFGQSSYAVFHEYGTRHMDRRGMLMADPDQGQLGTADEAAVLELLDEWLSGAASGQ